MTPPSYIYTYTVKVLSWGNLECGSTLRVWAVPTGAEQPKVLVDLPSLLLLLVLYVVGDTKPAHNCKTLGWRGVRAFVQTLTYIHITMV